MKIAKGALYAVLTGDIVRSSRMAGADRRALPGLLRRISRDVRRALPGKVPLDASVYRGDGWQLLLTDPAASLRAALLFRAMVIAAAAGGSRSDTRIAIGLGGIDFVDNERISEGDGEAYRLSGQALDAMREPHRMTLVRSTTDTANHGALVQLLDALVQEWTPFQARAVVGRIQGLTQAKIAGLWPEPIAQPSVAKHLERARWRFVEGALQTFEADLAHEQPSPAP